MAKLTENLSSRYFEAANTLRGLKHHLVKVFVEGYDDVAFWRGVLDLFENDELKFEISVPAREDLAKGKKVVMSFLPQSGPHLILCVDSDFDYLLEDTNEQSRQVNRSKYLFQTYAYATENYLCYPPSLHSLCVKATKNDRNIFDFVTFLTEYSRIIYPVFLWYVFSARTNTQRSFTLADFRNSVRIHFLDLHNNGENTLAWLRKMVDKRMDILRRRMKNPQWYADMDAFAESIGKRGVTRENVYLFMQGHTLKDNVVLVLLQAVCDKLREINNQVITSSTRTGVTLKNELSNYNNSLRNIKDILESNEGYRNCELYRRLTGDLRIFVAEVGRDTSPEPEYGDVR